MSQVKNFTAIVLNRIVSPLIEVKGEVNCGMLDVMPELTKRKPQGTNPNILLLDVLPASKDANGKFQEAEYTENIQSRDTYTEVQLMDAEEAIVATIEVQYASVEA